MIRSAQPGDADSLCRFRHALWPEGSATEHAEELRAFFNGSAREPMAVLVAEEPPATLVGFCELSIRPHAEGCLTDRVGYLEGWYVIPDARRRGFGRALVEAALEWARAQGCTELASDTASDNHSSAAAHLALGFSDAGLVRCFRQEL